jgi:hypothetical protein
VCEGNRLSTSINFESSTPKVKLVLLDKFIQSRLSFNVLRLIQYTTIYTKLVLQIYCIFHGDSSINNGDYVVTWKFKEGEYYKSWEMKEKEACRMNNKKKEKKFLKCQSYSALRE